MPEVAHAPFSTSLPAVALAEYVARQINHFFPDRDESESVRRIMPEVLERLEHCIRGVRIKGYWGHDGPQFNHLHTDQYAVFLYYLSNSAHKKGEASLAAKAYALNKALHGLDAFFEVELPAIWGVIHPVGTVLGRAKYSDYFLAYQNVGVGGDPFTNAHPTFGEGVVMYGGSRVIGGVTVGANCFVSAGAIVMRGEIAASHVVFGCHPHVTSKPTRHNVRRDVFKAGD